MTAFNAAGLAIIVAAWVWIAFAMRPTWPAVRAFARGVWTWLTWRCQYCGARKLVHYEIPGCAYCEDCGRPQ